MKIKKSLRISTVVIVILVMGMASLRIAGYRIYRYASGKTSMHPTISPGDVCLCRINQQFTEKNIRRGMIVLIEHQNYPYALTKRIIGQPGDVVRIIGTDILINGVKINEPYLVHPDPNISYGDVDSVRVPYNEYFVMGDNRPKSLDSRYSEFGLIGIDEIIGNPLGIVWSKDTKKIGRRLN